MSYETFHKIRQLENGDYLVTTKCSNDSREPHEWIMDYYRKQFPMLNNEQREAVFVIMGLYYGNVYYPQKYKKLEQIAIKYSDKLHSEKGYRPYDKAHGIFSKESFEREYEQGKSIYCSYEEYYNEWLSELLEVVNGFIKYKKESQKEPIVTVKIKLNNGYYVENLATNSRNIKITGLEQHAQVFKKTQEDLDKLIKKIPVRYEPQVISVA